MNNASYGGTSTKPLPLENYKNNLLKAKTEEIDSYNSRFVSGSSDAASKNPNLTNGESPPPKEVPDMSSATFVSVVRNQPFIHL